MKAAVYYSNDNVVTQDLPIPEIGERELLIKAHACGICVADTMEWYQKPKAPVVLGHEVAGTVEKVGAQVDEFSVGDRVFAHHHVACMVCIHCNRQNYTICETFKKTNYRPGGFCEYVAISERHLMDTLILPDHVSFEAGTLIEPLACVVRAIRRVGGVRSCDRVAIIGTGAIGIMLVQTLMAYGVRNIVCYELDEWRAKQAKSITGVSIAKPGRDMAENLAAYKDMTGFYGADKVFVMAKDIKAMELGLELAFGGGTVMLFATPEADESLPFFVSRAFFKELTICLSYSADHLDTREALALIAAGSIDTEALITHRFKLDETSAGILRTAGRGETLKCVVLI